MNDYPDIRTVTLEKLKFAMQQAISNELLNAHVDVQEHIDWMTDQAVVSIRGFIWAETLESETFQWPADWWQAFKERWFPAWAKRRWPVQYERHKLDVKAAYPNLKVSVPEQKYVIHVLEDWSQVARE